ncbi:efflux RND transporter periplasmic adaptor subunit [Prolixibacteraceae bacterium Z1-6]|uniref:Efflux RND transporter periplasmic adaptor subunit n=1 Tax=Draconibacterium aestuarii TaxID=2998507 RepID=A0A9X3F5C0_9BACT|nr:efflux RND transporter periplasmic adaptor subunit [Prolixibacteraceae bacterium Z1-6]
MNFKNVGLICVLIIVFWACKEEDKPVYPTVVAESVGHEDVELYGEYVGVIRAYRHVEVRARVQGYLKDMMFEEGKPVKKDEALFLIDPDLYEAKLDKAIAQLKRDSALYKKAKRDIERIRPLFQQNAASQLDLDNAVAAFENAEASIAMSKADVKQDELELYYTLARSPLNGIIGNRYVDVGTLVGPGNASLLATVVQTDTVFVNFSMTALDYLNSRERIGQIGEADSTRKWQPTVKVTLADGREYPIEGVVDFADPQVDPKTGTFGVRAELPNPTQVLLPGQFTRVRFLLDIIEDAVVLPRKALIIEKGGSFVYVMRRDSTAEARFVEPGHEYNNMVVIERGLGANEMVITEGQQKLTPGIKVKPVPALTEESSIVTSKENK